MKPIRSHDHGAFHQKPPPRSQDWQDRRFAEAVWRAMETCRFEECVRVGTANERGRVLCSEHAEVNDVR